MFSSLKFLHSMSWLQSGSSGTPRGKGIKEKEVREREKGVGEEGIREREKLYYAFS